MPKAKPEIDQSLSNGQRALSGRNVPSSEIQELLATPHYQLVASLRHGEDAEVISRVLDAVAIANPTRAALVLSDLYGLWGHTSFDHMRHNRESNLELAAALDRCTHVDAIKDALQILPTLDARTCRVGLLYGDELEKSRYTAGAMYAVMQPEHLPPTLTPLKKHLLDEFKAARFCAKQAMESFAPLRPTPQLSVRHQELLNQFSEMVSQDFPTEKYGYGHVYEKLQIGKKNGDVWTLKELIGSDVDSPNGEAHQCVDSASAARSFFVSHGIPADVYSATIGGMTHNVAVVFFPEPHPQKPEQAHASSAPWYVPVVVDASPIGGFYPLDHSRDHVGLSLTNPLGIQNVYNQRRNELPFIVGDRLDSLIGSAHLGLLPWLAKDLVGVSGAKDPGGDRVVLFAGVAANQEVSGPITYGTPEYWGGGVRKPRIVFQATVMPGPRSELAAGPYSPFIEIEFEAAGDSSGPAPGQRVLAVHKDSDRGVVLVATTQHSDVPESIVQEVMNIVGQELPNFSAFLERTGFSTEPRVFCFSS